MTQTVWRPVPGYADVYASIDGAIFSGVLGRETKQTRRPDGYMFVRIPGNKQELVHRLVAAAFLGECPVGWQVRHGNAIRSNNNVGNLCYGSPRDNTQDAMRDGAHQGVVMREKTECPRGHGYSPENTYINPSTGSRHCRTCQAQYLREYNARPENRARRAELRRQKTREA